MKYSEDKKRIIIDDDELYMKSQDNTFKENEKPVHVKSHGERNRYVISVLFSYAMRSEVNSALDVGTRSGIALEILETLGIDALGVDISPRAVEKAQVEGKNVIWGDAHHLSLVVKDKVDAIFLIHSLEHCHTPEKVVEECYNLLNDNGYIVMRLPVQKDLTEQKDKSGIHGTLPPHYSVYDKASLETLLIDNFEILHNEETVVKEMKDIIVIGRKR